MSKNISNLSGRIGLKKNLFEKISERSLNSKGASGIKEIANEYNMGVSTIHGAESFYEFLRPAHRAKKAFVCNGSACMCSGTQEPLKKKLKEKLGEDKVGEMFCLGHCYENNAFHYDGENYAGKDIDKIDQILKGENIKQDKFFSKSYATTSFLMDDKLSSTDQFKDQLNKFLKVDKKEIIKSLLDSNLTGRGGAGFTLLDVTNPFKPYHIYSVLNDPAAQKVFPAMLSEEKDAETIAKALDVLQSNDASLVNEIIDAVLSQHAEEVSRYRSGEKQLLGFLMGQVMRQSGGKIDPKTGNQVLREKLEG